MNQRMFWAAGLGQTVCYAGLLLAGNLRDHIPAALLLYGAACALYALMLRLVLSGEQGERSHAYLKLVLGFALLYRVMLLCSTPTLSDDIYRYVWEGLVVRSGFNPFSLAPDAQQLAALRDAAVFPQITRPNLTGIYPPLAQYIFAGASFLWPTITGMKAVFVLFDLATILLIISILGTLNENKLKSAIYALNPLIILEFSGSGHLDSAGIFFMTLALYAALKKKELLSAASLGAGVLVKFIPALLLPLCVKKNKFAGLLIFPGIVAAGFIPFIDAKEKLFASLFLYLDNWTFNASVYTLLLHAIPDNQLARRAAAAVFFIMIALIYSMYFRRSRAKQEIVTTCELILIVLLLLSPVVHPWYVCWAVPVAAITGNRALLVFSGTVFLSYWVLRDYAVKGLWHEEPLVLALEYIPVYSLLVYDLMKKKVTFRVKKHLPV